jgi:hypothetical protein
VGPSEGGRGRGAVDKDTAAFRGDHHVNAISPHLNPWGDEQNLPGVSGFRWVQKGPGRPAAEILLEQVSA